MSQQFNVSAISTSLEKTLDLDQPQVNISTALGCQNPSASKLLLQERNNIQQSQQSQFEMTSFVPRSKTVKPNPLLQQISHSIVEKPKYWKDSSKKRVVVKSKSSSKTGRKNKQKGEEYKDRFQKKISASQKKRN